MATTKKIAITGGIGSGKSLAMYVLSQAGYNTLSCDDMTDYLYTKRKVKKMLKYIFPECVTGRLFLEVDRKKLAALVFNDKKLLSELMSLTTTLIMDEIEKRIKKAYGLVFVEVPLLFENHLEKSFDEVLVITRPYYERIESVKKRSDMTDDEVIARMNNQVDYDKMDLSPYHVIFNDADPEALKNKVLEFALKMQ